MIQVSAHIALDERDIEERFIRASGPGGQNVNKVSTAVELRYVLDGLAPLPEAVRHRLARLAGRRLSADGVLVILADGYRTQDANRRDALERLLGLVRKALVAPKRRRATKPTLASKTRRLEAKGRRSEIKRLRNAKPASD